MIGEFVKGYAGKLLRPIRQNGVNDLQNRVGSVQNSVVGELNDAKSFCFQHCLTFEIAHELIDIVVDVSLYFDH